MCRTPAKKRHPSQYHAERHLAAVNQQRDTGMHVYECWDGRDVGKHYHIGHRSKTTAC